MKTAGHIRTGFSNGLKLWKLFKEAGYCYDVKINENWVDILWSIDGKKWREYRGDGQRFAI